MLPPILRQFLQRSQGWFRFYHYCPFALGYFNDGFSVATEAASITDSASLTTFLGSFNVLHSQSSQITAAGFFTPGNSSIAEPEKTHISCHLQE